MKSLYILIIIIILISCSTDIKKNEDADFNLKSEEEKLKTHVISTSPEEEFFFSSDKGIPIILKETVLPYVDFNFAVKESIDPVLHLINLKKKYFNYNSLVDSDFLDNEVSAIYVFDDIYYMGTLRGAVFQSSINEPLNIIIKEPYNSLQNRRINCLLKSGELLFIGTSSGLYTYNVVTKELLRHNQAFSNAQISSICKVEDIVLLGTMDGKLFVWDQGDFTLIGTVGYSQINSINYLNERIFLGTSGNGVYEYMPNENILVLLEESYGQKYNQKVNFITFFDDKYWVGSPGNGIYTFDINLQYIANISSDRWILCTVQSERFIYFGTHSEGLLFYDKIDKKWGSWGVRNGLSSLYIPSLYFLDNNLYISTPDKGIVIINEKIHGQNL